MDFKLQVFSRVLQTLTVQPSRFAFEGLSAHNKKLKKNLLRSEGRKNFRTRLYEEFDLFIEGLNWLGSYVHLIKALGGKSCPDCMFCQDLALRLKGSESDLFISPNKMGAKARRKEAERLRNLFGKDVKVVTLPGRIDFGDVIAVETNAGNFLLIGVRNNPEYERLTEENQTKRTTIKAIKSLEKHAKKAGYQTIRVEHSALHLTTAMTMAGQAEVGDPLVFLHNEWLINPTKVTEDIAQALNVSNSLVTLLSTAIESGSNEEKAKASWSSSCVGHNGKVLIQEGAAIRIELENLGFEVLEIPFTHIRSLDGGMTCLILELLGLKPKKFKAVK